MSAASQDPSNRVRLKPLTKGQLEMFEENKKLVNYVISKTVQFDYMFNRDKKRDMQQVGYMGLARATQTFNPDKGFNFSTYAFTSIRTNIFRFLMRYSKTYIVPYEVDIRDYRNLPGEWSIYLEGGSFSVDDVYVEKSLTSYKNLIGDLKVELGDLRFDIMRRIFINEEFIKDVRKEYGMPYKPFVQLLLEIKQVVSDYLIDREDSADLHTAQLENIITLEPSRNFEFTTIRSGASGRPKKSPDRSQGSD